MIITDLKAPEGFISVKSLIDARKDWNGFDHVITIEDVEFEGGLRIPAGGKTTQTVMKFDDTDTQFGPFKAADPDEVKRLLLVGRSHANSKLLVHCLQGQSRSAAIALGIIADRLGAGREAEAVATLLRIRSSAVCNRLIVRYCDTLLARKGELLKAWDAHLKNDDKAAGVMLLRGLAERQGDNQ